MLRSHAMTIGQLSLRTRVPIKVLRKYEGLGFLSTLGRSESNYRLFGEEALRCVQVVQNLRSLGLTLKEIQSLIKSSCKRPGEPVDGLSTTRAGTLLKQQIPIRTFQEWKETQPGFLEADLVAHCGTDIEGGYVYTAFARRCGHGMDRMPPPLASEPESRSGENASWAGGAPTKTPLKGSGSRSPPG